VVAPPSLHPGTGNRYRWRWAPDKYELAPSPAWLVARLAHNGTAARAANEPFPSVLPASEDTLAKYRRKLGNDYKLLTQTQPVSNRHGYLYHLIPRLFIAGMAPDEVLSVVCASVLLKRYVRRRNVTRPREAATRSPRRRPKPHRQNAQEKTVSFRQAVDTVRKRDDLAVSVLAGLLITDEVLDVLAERVAARLGTQDQQPQWLTTQQAADYLAVPVSRVYRAVSMRRSAKRPIPVHKDGQHSFFVASELDAWRAAGGTGQ
jgi:excisionase family DNA binding protein